MHAKDIKMKVLFQWSKSDHFISEYFSGWLKEKDFQLVAKTAPQWWPQPLHWTGGSYSPPAASSSTSTVWGRRTGRGGGSLCCDLSTKQRTATSRWLVPEPPSLSQIVIEKAVFNLNNTKTLRVLTSTIICFWSCCLVRYCCYIWEYFITKFRLTNLQL